MDISMKTTTVKCPNGITIKFGVGKSYVDKNGKTRCRVVDQIFQIDGKTVEKWENPTTKKTGYSEFLPIRVYTIVGRKDKDGKELPPKTIADNHLLHMAEAKTLKTICIAISEQY